MCHTRGTPDPQQSACSLMLLSLIDSPGLTKRAAQSSLSLTLVLCSPLSASPSLLSPVPSLPDHSSGLSQFMRLQQPALLWLSCLSLCSVATIGLTSFAEPSSVPGRHRQNALPSPTTTLLLPPPAQPCARSALCHRHSALLMAPTVFPLEDLFYSFLKFLMALLLVPSPSTSHQQLHTEWTHIHSSKQLLFILRKLITSSL